LPPVTHLNEEAMKGYRCKLKVWGRNLVERAKRAGFSIERIGPIKPPSQTELRGLQ